MGLSNMYYVGAVSRAISQLIGMILYGLQTIGHTWVFPLWLATQHLVPYSENKGYVSNLRRFCCLISCEFFFQYSLMNRKKIFSNKLFYGHFLSF